MNTHEILLRSTSQTFLISSVIKHVKVSFKKKIKFNLNKNLKIKVKNKKIFSHQN